MAFSTKTYEILIYFLRGLTSGRRSGAQYDYVIVIKFHARGAPPSKRTLSSTTCIVGRSGLGNLELKMVAISYEMSLCPSQNQLRTYGEQTARANMRSHSKTIHWIRCRLVLRSSIMCLRGSRSASHRPAGPPITTNTMDLACSEGRVPGSSQD